MYSAVVFDMDGVLVNSEPWHAESWSAVMADHGHEVAPGYFLNHSVGIADEEFVHRMRAEHGVAAKSDQLLAEKRERYMQYARSEVQLYPGALALLDSLSRRCKVGLATSSTMEQAELFLERFQLRQYFQSVAARESVPLAKPFPDIYVYSAHQLDEHPGRCVAIEDSPTGIKAAVAAGFGVVAIASTHRKHALGEAGVVLSGLEPIQRSLDAIATVCYDEVR